MNEKVNTCEWCGQNEGREYFPINGERFCSNCQPYGWAGFMKPDYYESNKQLAIKKAKRRGTFTASEWKSPSTSRWVEHKELVAARIAFGGMFLAVLVAVYGIYLVGGKC